MGNYFVIVVLFAHIHKKFSHQIIKCEVTRISSLVRSIYSLRDSHRFYQRKTKVFSVNSIRIQCFNLSLILFLRDVFLSGNLVRRLIGDIFICSHILYLYYVYCEIFLVSWKCIKNVSFIQMGCQKQFAKLVF